MHLNRSIHPSSGAITVLGRICELLTIGAGVCGLGYAGIHMRNENKMHVETTSKIIAKLIEDKGTIHIQLNPQQLAELKRISELDPIRVNALIQESLNVPSSKKER